MRGRLLRVGAIILKGRDYAEADRLLTLFSREEGKLQAIARGVRKPRSKNRGALQLYSRSEFLLYRGASLFTVCQCQLQEPLAAGRANLSALAHAAYLAEVVDGFQQEHDANRGLFHLFSESLVALGRGGAEQDQVLASFFTVHLLALSGYRLNLAACAACGGELVAPVSLLPGQGGTVCGRCALGGEAGSSLSPAALAALRYLERSSLEALPRLKLAAAVRLEIEAALQAVLTFHLERRIKSLDFLREVRSLAGKAGLSAPLPPVSPAIQE